MGCGMDENFREKWLLFQRSMDDIKAERSPLFYSPHLGRDYSSTHDVASSNNHFNKITSGTQTTNSLSQDSISSINSIKKDSGCTTFLKQNKLTFATLLGVVLGIGVGIALRTLDGFWTERNLMYLSFPGDIFLQMLKGLILPLIMSSMVAAMGSLDTNLSGRIGLRAVVYYICSTTLAITLGIVLVISIHPGSDNSAQSDKRDARYITTADTLLDLIRNAFPPNIIEACISQVSTSLIKPPEDDPRANESMYTWDITTQKESGTNILGVIVFSLALGGALAKIGPKGKPLLDLFISFFDAIMTVTKWVIWLSPVGVMFLVMSKVVEMEDMKVVAGQVGKYFLTVLLGLFIHGLITLPTIYALIVRKNPFVFILNMLQAITTAFGTASSSATLPITIAALEEKVKIDPRIVKFCVPIGATINMDGTALYEAVAAIFIAQVRQVPLDVGKIIAISVTATAASIGAAGIPQAGLVTMVMVLNAVGLPADDISLILVVDWLLDRFRTAINVLGDSTGACVVNKLSEKDLNRTAYDYTGSTETVVTAM